MDIDGIYYCSRCMRKVDDDLQTCPHCGFDSANATTNSQHLAEGTFLNNRYLLGAVIGAGGFGVTYAAWDENLSVPVAIKEYFPVKYAYRNTDESDELLPHEEGKGLFALGLSRFRKEAQVLAQFQNVPGIVNIKECFDENETAYIAMEFVHGMPLDEYVRENHPSPKKLLDIMLPAINALETIHRQGINHRDIKPENLLVQKDGSIKLIDFGSAREVEHVTNLIVVSDGYAPLEQYDLKQPQGPWSDVYGINATIYHMLTGVMPEASISRDKHDTLKKPSKLGVKLKKYQEDTLMAGLAVEPQKRIQSIAEFRALLYNMPLPEEVRRRKTFMRRVIATAVAIMMLMAAVFVNFACGFPLGEGLLYSLYPDGWHVAGVTGAYADVVVPGKRLAIPVSVIDPEVFRDSSTLETIVLPGSVKEIASQSFSNCSALTTVTLEDGIENISSLAFNECAALHTVYLPDSVSNVAPTAFGSPSSYLTVWGNPDHNVVLPDGLNLADRDAYTVESNMTGLTLMSAVISPEQTTIVLPSYIDGQPVTHVAVDALGETIPEWVTRITFPFYMDTIFPWSNGSVVAQGVETVYYDEVLYIEGDSFKGARVGKFTFPSKLKTIGYNAFQGSSIASVELPDSVEEIDLASFAECVNLKKVKLSSSMKEIPGSAFSGCPELQSVLIPEGIEIINSDAFSECESLKYIWLPESIHYIAERAFGHSVDRQGLSELQYLYIPAGTELEKDALDSISGIIAGYPGSAAEMHANKNGLKFEDVSRWNTFPDPNTPGIIMIDLCELEDVVCASFDQTNNVPVTKVGTYASQSDVVLRSVDLPLLTEVILDEAFSDTYELGKIEFPLTVKRIGSHTFHYSGVKEVTMPLALESTNLSNSFWGSKNLSVIIPDGATSIGDRMFYDCDFLGTITIPDSVTSIGNSAFVGTSLTSIMIPNSVTKIGNRIFASCYNLSSIYVSPDHPIFETIDGVLFDRKEKRLLCYPPGKNKSSYTIPQGTESIGSHAFDWCRPLMGITIPDSVTTIESYAFDGCSSLTSIIIPDSVTSIGDHAFGSCSSLTSIMIPDSVTSIGDHAFYGCSSLTSIMIPDSVTSIGDHAFDRCKLTNITIPDSVTSIGDYAFYGCSSLTSIMIPDSVTSIGDHAFYGCSSLTSIMIPDSVTSIGDYAFSSCKSLTSITVPYSVTSIGDGAFNNCDSLTSITVPDSVTSIGEFAFEDCDSLTSITIPDSVSYIGNETLSNCTQLSSIIVSPDHPTLITVDGVLFDRCENRLLCYPHGLAATHYKIPDGTNSIAPRAFSGRSSLTSIRLPDSMTSIGESAFEDCDSLTSITIPDSVTTIGDNALYDCNSLTNITIPDSVTSIGECAFWNCESLASITIPDSVTSIGESAFQGCKALSSITIPDSVTYIGDCAFDYCYSLTSVRIPDSITNIGRFVFRDCNSLTSIRIPNTVTSIDYCAFAFCSSLSSITIPASVTNIGINAFYECSPNLIIQIEPKSYAAQYCQDHNLQYVYADAQPDT